MRRMRHAHLPGRRGRAPVGLWLPAAGHCPRLRRDGGRGGKRARSRWQAGSTRASDADARDRSGEHL
jgi:hypothetical protein